jgi:hypothetical protein
MAAYVHVSSAATLETWVRISLGRGYVLVPSLGLCCTVCVETLWWFDIVPFRRILLVVAIVCTTGEVNLKSEQTRGLETKTTLFWWFLGLRRWAVEFGIGVGFGATSLAGLHSPNDAPTYSKRAKTQDVFYWNQPTKQPTNQQLQLQVYFTQRICYRQQKSLWCHKSSASSIARDAGSITT